MPGLRDAGTIIWALAASDTTDTPHVWSNAGGWTADLREVYPDSDSQTGVDWEELPGQTQVDMYAALDASLVTYLHCHQVDPGGGGWPNTDTYIATLPDTPFPGAISSAKLVYTYQGINGDSTNDLLTITVKEGGVSRGTVSHTINHGQVRQDDVELTVTGLTALADVTLELACYAEVGTLGGNVRVYVYSAYLEIVWTATAKPGLAIAVPAAATGVKFLGRDGKASPETPGSSRDKVPQPGGLAVQPPVRATIANPIFDQATGERVHDDDRALEFRNQPWTLYGGLPQYVPALDIWRAPKLTEMTALGSGFIQETHWREASFEHVLKVRNEHDAAYSATPEELKGWGGKVIMETGGATGVNPLIHRASIDELKDAGDHWWAGVYTLQSGSSSGWAFGNSPTFRLWVVNSGSLLFTAQIRTGASTWLGIGASYVFTADTPFAWFASYDHSATQAEFYVVTASGGVVTVAQQGTSTSVTMYGSASAGDLEWWVPTGAGANEIVHWRHGTEYITDERRIAALALYGISADDASGDTLLECNDRIALNANDARITDMSTRALPALLSGFSDPDAAVEQSTYEGEPAQSRTRLPLMTAAPFHMPLVERDRALGIYSTGRRSDADPITTEALVAVAMDGNRLAWHSPDDDAAGFANTNDKIEFFSGVQSMQFWIGSIQRPLPINGQEFDLASGDGSPANGTYTCEGVAGDPVLTRRAIHPGNVSFKTVYIAESGITGKPGNAAVIKVDQTGGTPIRDWYYDDPPDGLSLGVRLNPAITGQLTATRYAATDHTKDPLASLIEDVGPERGASVVTMDAAPWIFYGWLQDGEAPIADSLQVMAAARYAVLYSTPAGNWEGKGFDPDDLGTADHTLAEIEITASMKIEGHDWPETLRVLYAKNWSPTSRPPATHAPDPYAEAAAQEWHSATIGTGGPPFAVAETPFLREFDARAWGEDFLRWARGTMYRHQLRAPMDPADIATWKLGEVLDVTDSRVGLSAAEALLVEVVAREDGSLAIVSLVPGSLP